VKSIRPAANAGTKGKKAPYMGLKCILGDLN